MTLAEINRMIRAAIRAANQEGIHNVEVKYLAPEHQPEPTCLYRHFDKDGQLLYVGISRDVWKRQSDHRIKSHWYDLRCPRRDRGASDALRGVGRRAGSHPRREAPAQHRVEGGMTTRLLKPQDVAERLGCTVKTLFGHVRDGSLRYVNVGRGEFVRAICSPRVISPSSRKCGGAVTQGQCHVRLPAKGITVLPIRFPMARSSLSRLYESNQQARSGKGRTRPSARRPSSTSPRSKRARRHRCGSMT